MKLSLLLLITLLTYSMALDITLVGDIFGSLGSTFTGDVNIGTLSALTPDSVFNLTSSSTIIGVVTLGSNGIITSTPTLFIVPGESMTCSDFVLDGGSVSGSGSLIVLGNLEVNAATTFSGIVGAQTCSINEAVSVAGGMAITAAAQIDGALTCEAGSYVDFMAGISGVGMISAEGELVLSAGSLATITTGIAVEATGSLTATGHVVLEGVLDIASKFDVQAGANVTIGASVSSSSLFALINTTGMLIFKANTAIEVAAHVACYETGKVVVAGETLFSGLVYVASEMAVEANANFNNAVGIAEDKFLTIANNGEAIFTKSITEGGNLLVQGSCVIYNTAEEIEVAVDIAVSGAGELLVNAQTTFNGTVEVAAVLGVRANATFNKEVSCAEGNIIVVLEDAEAKFNDALTGAGELLVQGMCSFHNNAQVAVGITISESGTVVAAGETMFMGLINASSDLVVAGNASFFEAVTCTESNVVYITEKSKVYFFDSLTGLGQLLVDGECTFYNTEKEIDIAVDVTISQTGYFLVGAETVFHGAVNVGSQLFVGSNATFNKAVNCAQDKLIYVASEVNAYFHDSVEGAGQVAIYGVCTFDATASEAQVTTEVAVTALGKAVCSGHNHFRGLISLDGSLDIEEDANVTIGASVTGAGTINVKGSLLFDAAGTLSVASNLLVEATGDAVCSANTAYDTAVDVYGSLTVEANAEVSFKGLVSVHNDGNLEIEGKATCEASGELELGVSSHAMISGIFDISCDVSGGTIEYNNEEPQQGQEQDHESEISSSNCESNLLLKNFARVRSTADTTFADISLEGSSSFTVERSSTCSAISTAGSASLTLGSVGSLSVQGSATFASGSTYTVQSSSATASNCLVVTGEATLGGNLVVDTSITFDASTKLTVITYGSRASSSTFASITVNAGSKRDTQEDEYEVIYESDRAYVQKASSDSSSTSDNSMTSILLPAVAILLLTILF